MDWRRNTNTNGIIMTTLKGIRGKTIQNFTTDPTDTELEGQLWYNTTSGAFKTALGGYGVWAAGGNLNTARQELAGIGTQTAALAFGGDPARTNSESYNGTSWTATSTLNTGRGSLAGAGTNTAGLAFGGTTTTYSAATESWNGTSWTTSPATLNTARTQLGGTGTQTAALGFGGNTTAPGAATNVSESYNGTTWTNTSNMNTSRRQLAGAGTQTSSLAFGGNASLPNANNTTATETYNGSSWTSVNSMNTARRLLAGCGTQTSALGFGGYITAISASTEKWNGTSWTSSPTGLATARTSLAGAGSQTAALAFGGYTTAASAATEAWTQSVTVPVAGSWSSGGALPASKFIATGFGSQTAAIIAGGDSGGSIVGTAFTYNGTSWSPSPSLNTSRSGLMSSTNAPQTAGVVFGGYTTYPNMLTATELWNGTAWTNNPTGLNTARQNGGGAGIQTAAICVGGEAPGGATNAVENFNGTSWTTSPVTFPSSGPGIRGFGLQTASIFIKSGVSQSWNGTAFSSAGTQNSPSDNRGVFGIQTAGVAAGRQAAPPTGATELWNGSAWTSSSNSLATSRYGLVGFGTQSSGLGSGGYTGTAYSTATEEWTGPSTTLNFKSVTTS